MIKTKKDLKRILEIEKNFYYKAYTTSPKDVVIRILTKSPLIYTYKYVKYLRLCEYYNNNNCMIRYAIYRRKKNIFGIKLGIEAYENNFEEGLTIYHVGNIVINKEAKIGKNCVLHGDNCIGNNGKDSGAPVIGNNVDIGVGAKIIGDVYIADNIKIGAGAIVNKSFYEEGITICGVPAKKIIKNY